MLIGGLDVGTTGTKLTVYNTEGQFVNNEYIEYDVSRQNGEHEIDATVIFDAVCKVITKTTSSFPELEAVGVTTFGETFVVLDDEDNPLFPSMLYTDPRGKDEVGELNRKLGEKTLASISGVKPHQMYSLPKIMWLKNNYPDIFKKAKRILLMEDYIVYMLTGNAQIDYSLAARTMALDIRKKQWSKEILSASQVDENLLSKPVPAGTVAGCIRNELSEKLQISNKLMIVNGSHDQVAAAIGAGIFEIGQAIDGTGTVECVTPMFDSIPDNEQIFNEGYSVVPYVFDGTYVCYALSFTGGATLKWYRDCFGKYEEMLAREKGENVYALLDNQVPEPPTNLLILPHFAGAANPYMDNNSKAAIVGLSLEHTNSHIYKALMEGVTYEILVNIEHLSDSGITAKKLYATGGGASSPVWLQIKADILNRPITALDAKEAGACGTCMLTAVATGAVKNLKDAKRLFVKEKKTYLPNPTNADKYKKNFDAYKKLYGAVRPIIEEITTEVL